MTSFPFLTDYDPPGTSEGTLDPLSLGNYNSIFRFAQSIEAIAAQPLFQYIGTTTTRPPDELCASPWLCLKLEGTPAAARLFRRDL